MWVQALLFLAAFLLAQTASAAACTDGSNCLCDVHPVGSTIGGATVLMCEDFESALLRDGDTAVYNDSYVTQYGSEAQWGDGWYQVYGPESDECLNPNLPSGFGIKPRGGEGTHSWSCFNIVQAGNCEGLGDTSGCVQDGNNSLMWRFRPGQRGGIVGRKHFGTTRNFGITMAMKWSAGWNGPQQGVGPGNKTDEWGLADNCILGCSTGNANQTQSPFAGTVKIVPSDPGGTAVVGQKEYDGSTGYRYGPNPPAWGWTRDRWYCLQFQADNWGLSNGRLRYWIDSTLLVDLQNVNLSSHTQDAAGIGDMSFNDYFNGPGPGDQGYQGSPAARFEDNIVVTNGAPAPCSTIGFGAPVAPAIGLSTSTLSPAVAVGNNAAPQTFTISNTGVGTLSYTVSDNVAWLSVAPASGTSTGAQVTETVTYATSGLTAGTYTGTITVADGSASNTPQTIAVTLTVTNPATPGSLHLTVGGLDATSATSWDWSLYPEWTWEAMFKLDSASAVWKRGISTKAGDPASSVLFVTDPTGKLRWEREGSVANGLQTTTSYPTDLAWHRISQTFKSGVYSIYIDGTLAGSSTGKTAPSTASNGKIRFGDAYNDGGSLLGRIADVRLLNVAKGQTWIDQHKDCRLKAATAGLVDLWKLDESSGQTAANTASSPTHGDITIQSGQSMDNGDTPTLSGTSGTDCAGVTPADTLTIGNVTASPTSGTVTFSSTITAPFVGTGGAATATAKADCDVNGSYETTGTTGTTPQTVSCSFTSAGTYLVPVKVSGGTAPDSSSTVTIQANAPAVVTLNVDSITPSPTTGSAPFSPSETVSLSGSATGSAMIEADCDNNGSYERSATVASAPFTYTNICTFSFPGVYTVPVRVTRQAVTAYKSFTATATSVGVPTLCCAQ